MVWKHRGWNHQACRILGSTTIETFNGVEPVEAIEPCIDDGLMNSDSVTSIAQVNEHLQLWWGYGHGYGIAKKSRN